MPVKYQPRFIVQCAEFLYWWNFKIKKDSGVTHDEQLIKWFIQYWTCCQYNCLTFHSLYFKNMQELIGKFQGEIPNDEIISKVSEYCVANHIKMAFSLDNGILIIAMVDQLMVRVHENVLQSKEIVFLDASGNMDR